MVQHRRDQDGVPRCFLCLLSLHTLVEAGKGGTWGGGGGTEGGWGGGGGHTLTGAVHAVEGLAGQHDGAALDLGNEDLTALRSVVESAAE